MKTITLKHPIKIINAKTGNITWVTKAILKGDSFNSKIMKHTTATGSIRRLTMERFE